MSKEIPIPQLTVDPELTSKDKGVDRNEMYDIHNCFDTLDASGVNIVVQDTGLDHDHPWVSNQTDSTSSLDFTGHGKGDSEGHGTMVTDLATRYANGASVEMHKTLGTDSLQAFYDSFGVMLNNPEDYDVLVMSWQTRGYDDDRINRIVDEVADKGIVPVAAAGNHEDEVGSPATADKCISVGALEESGTSITNFSSWDIEGKPDLGFGGIPEISAIGDSIIGANADHGDLGEEIDPKRTVASGTSFSCPFIANLVADIVHRTEDPTVEDILISLEKSAVDIEKTTKEGMGRVNSIKFAEEHTGQDIKSEKQREQESTVFILTYILNIFRKILKS